MATTPTREPGSFIAGETVIFTKYFSDYLPADGWVLSYTFIQGSRQVAITATDNGDGRHLVSITSAQSSAFQAGLAHYQGIVEKGAERYSVASGEVDIKPDFSTLANGYDARSVIKKTLDALDSLLLNKASEDAQTLSINGRSLTKLAPEELLKWRSHYAELYRREQNSIATDNGLSKTNFIHMRF